MKGLGKVVCIAFVYVGVYASPGALKNTLACLNDEHTDLSLIHGTLAWETGAIRRMYDYGALGSKGDKISLKTITLVHKLFHRPPDSSGPAGFLVTKSVRELPNEQVAEFVADTVVFLKQLLLQESFKQYQKERQTYCNFIVTHDESEQKKIKQLEKRVGNARRAVLEVFDVSGEYTQHPSPLKELAHYPVKAFLECAGSEYMPVTMPQTILQALLYKKTEGDSGVSRRRAFRKYYERLDNSLGCLAHPLPATWEQDFFSSDQRELLLAEITTLPPAQAYERAVFLRLTPTDYPPFLSYGDAMIQGAVFTDCMENTMRNISNFLAYNSQTGLFDVELLERRLGTHVHASVKRFYEQFGDPAMADQKSAHNAWVQLCARLPNQIYCRALPSISHQKKDCICVEPETPITTELCAKKGYVALPPHTISYDMRPSIKNFMLTCDYLFGLQLFKNLPADAWAREGFITTQLPRVIGALKARVPASLDYAALEQDDGSETPLFVPLTFSFADNQSARCSSAKHQPCTLTVHTEYDDGEVLFNQPSTLPVALPAQEAMHGDSRFLLASAQEVQVNGAEAVLAWLFAQNIADNAQRYALMQQIPVFNERILEVLLFSARKHASGDEQTLHILRSYQEALSRGLAENRRVVHDALAEASEAVLSKNMLVRGEALQLFKTLFTHGKGIDAVITHATTVVRSSNKKEVSAGVALFTTLVACGKALDAAEKAVQSVTQSPGSFSTGLRFEALQLAAKIEHQNSLIKEG